VFSKISEILALMARNHFKVGQVGSTQIQEKCNNKSLRISENWSNLTLNSLMQKQKVTLHGQIN
jgi:hypothetical protein